MATLAEILALLADNTTGDISAGDVRAAVTALWPSSGTTASRPVANVVGFSYFDTTLGIPIFWNGAAWIDATGSVV